MGWSNNTSLDCMVGELVWSVCQEEEGRKGGGGCEVELG